MGSARRAARGPAPSAHRIGSCSKPRGHAAVKESCFELRPRVRAGFVTAGGKGRAPYVKHTQPSRFVKVPTGSLNIAARQAQSRLRQLNDTAATRSPEG